MHHAPPTIDTPGNLDPNEQHFRIPGPLPGLHLFLRYLPPTTPTATPHCIVLYVHGGTFPSALSIAHRFDGQSWRDTLCAAGFHIWGLDFHGFGACPTRIRKWRTRPTRIRRSAALKCQRQLEQAIRFICNYHGTPRMSLIAHSWGTHRRRPARRALPGTDRSHGVFRRHRARSPRARQRSATAGMAADLAAGPMEPFHRRRAGRRAAGAVARGISTIGASAISTPIRPAARARRRR